MISEILVCFAVKEEAKFFNPNAFQGGKVDVLLSGIGRHNAENAIRATLATRRFGLVISAGFAGGLRPELKTGDVLISVDDESGLSAALLAAGAMHGKFFCAERVAVTVQEKRELYKNTGAEAVEMESQVICSICRQQRLPCATVRVILDTAAENLPLDFNILMTADQRLDNGKLALAVLKSPGKISSLLRLQNQTRAAAKRLATVLDQAIRHLLESSPVKSTFGSLGGSNLHG